LRTPPPGLSCFLGFETTGVSVDGGIGNALLADGGIGDCGMVAAVLVGVGIGTALLIDGGTGDSLRARWRFVIFAGSVKRATLLRASRTSAVSTLLAICDPIAPSRRDRDRGTFRSRFKRGSRAGLIARFG
jgi:hypothetical protein